VVLETKLILGYTERRTQLERVGVRFDDLKDYPFSPYDAEVDTGDVFSLRMHDIDEGEGEIIEAVSEDGSDNDEVHQTNSPQAR
jgi:hypothetical protein